MTTMISTERTVLRRLVPADAPAMFAYRSDPDVARYQGWDPGTTADVEGFIADQQAVDYIFGTLGKHRVYGSVDPRNTASMALLERVGLRKEAHHRQSLWFKGEWADDVIYATLADEWPGRR